MNKTKIEWADYTWNPITGCENNCSYCYAKKIGLRFNKHFKPTFHSERLFEPTKINKSSKIFTCSMGEMFGDWIPNFWITQIFNIFNQCPQHTFQVLTKCPARMIKYYFPNNVWTGVTIDSFVGMSLIWLRQVHSKVKFVSFEPLLNEIDTDLEDINWIIIGSQTNPYKPPKKEWVEKLINEARTHDIPIFLKNNLKWKEKIQEFPSDMSRLVATEKISSEES